VKSKGIYLGISLLLALFLFFAPSLSAGQKTTHIVKQGDTLWSICEQYYGDPYLWPELWEMNQFITNPHWLNPGDVITIFEVKEKKLEPRKGPQKKTVKLEKRTLIRPPMGIAVSSFTNTKALGFFAHETTQPWGKIFDYKAEKILLSENDIVYVKMYKRGINPGDRFYIYNVSNPISHPLTGEESAFIHSFKGILEIEKSREDYHIATISESFSSIEKNDLIMPYYAVSPCIFPISSRSTRAAHILAAKDNLHLLAHHSVVYIDAGSDKKIQRGNILEVIEKRESVVEPQTKEKAFLPPTICGKILILKTTKNISTGVVFWASKNFTDGVTVRPLAWHKRPAELANLPACPRE